MRYGLVLPNAGPCDARKLSQLASIAEEAGWDGIFLEDYIVHHHAHDVPTYDPWVALAAMALHTEHIRLGTTVTPLPRRRPWKLARETVTLDRLSNGRLILGVGLGDLNDAGFGRVGEATEDRQRGRMVDEALDVLEGLWSGQPFSYHGAHYQVDDVTFQPTPAQASRIPIWIGGGWPKKGIVQRAARYDGICPYKIHEEGAFTDMTPAEVQALKASIQSLRSTSAPFDIALGGRERDDDLEQDRSTIRLLAGAGATWWIEYIPVGELEGMRACVKRGPLRID